LAEAQGMYVGAAINTGAFRQDDAYRALVEREFNIITPENMFKFGPLSRGRDQYFWEDTDALVDWAEEHDMRVHGHVLVWHNQQPAWLNEDAMTAAEIAATLENHIRTVVGRYQGRIQEWDVVNEAITDNGLMRDTIWRRALGDDYIAKAFQWAHEADPDALLYYNDYNADTPGRKADAIYDLVAGLLEAGVPIHGVGLQAHLTHEQVSSASTRRVRQVMDRLDELGLRVAVTEMDVRIHHPSRSRSDMLEVQAEIYGNVLTACREAPNCDTFVAWGVSDQYSWIPGFTGNDDWPLLYDADLNPKPAYFAVVDALAAAGE
jgi:endo-1,4-beta-xylanase